MRCAFLRGSTLSELEVTNPGTPVKAGCRLVVLVCVVERALVNRIEGHCAVVAPAVSTSHLDAGASLDLRLSAQGVKRVAAKAPGDEYRGFYG